MTTLLRVIDKVERLPAQDRQKIADCEFRIWKVIDRYDNEGKLAVQLVALSIIEDEEEAREIAKEEAANKKNCQAQ
jgi:macrodomain Ter protein organizer (MatP/YcbG family)